MVRTICVKNWETVEDGPDTVRYKTMDLLQNFPQFCTKTGNVFGSFLCVRFHQIMVAFNMQVIAVCYEVHTCKYRTPSCEGTFPLLNVFLIKNTLWQYICCIGRNVKLKSSRGKSDSKK